MLIYIVTETKATFLTFGIPPLNTIKMSTFFVDLVNINKMTFCILSQVQLGV